VRQDPACATDWRLRQLTPPERPVSRAAYLFDVLLQKAEAQARILGLDANAPDGGASVMLQRLAAKLGQGTAAVRGPWGDA
jgi:hypothetical protein